MLYTADIPAIFSKHSSSGHLYADDVQASVHGPPSDQLALTGRIDALSQDLHLRMSSNRLSLNPNERNLSGSALPCNFRSLTSHCSQKDFPPLPFIPVFETLA